jgi:chaperonin cofactor prefoldin
MIRDRILAPIGEYLLMQKRVAEKTLLDKLNDKLDDLTTLVDRCHLRMQGTEDRLGRMEDRLERMEKASLPAPAAEEVKSAFPNDSKEPANG